MQHYNPISGRLALTSLIAWLGLVDDVNAALAAHELVVAMATTQRLERVADLHGRPRLDERVERPTAEKADRHMPQPDPPGQPHRGQKSPFLRRLSTDRPDQRL